MGWRTPANTLPIPANLVLDGNLTGTYVLDGTLIVTRALNETIIGGAAGGIEIHDSSAGLSSAAVRMRGAVDTGLPGVLRQKQVGTAPLESLTMELRGQTDSISDTPAVLLTRWTAADIGGPGAQVSIQPGTQGGTRTEILLGRGIVVNDNFGEMRRGNWRNLANLGFVNGWTAGTPAPQYRLMPDGTVMMRGKLTPGTITSGTTITTLDNTVLAPLPGYAPRTSEVRFPVSVVPSTARASVRILASGDVQIVDTVGTPTTLSLDGIRFDVINT